MSMYTNTIIHVCVCVCVLVIIVVSTDAMCVHDCLLSKGRVELSVVLHVYGIYNYSCLGDTVSVKDMVNTFCVDW